MQGWFDIRKSALQTEIITIQGGGEEEPVQKASNPSPDGSTLSGEGAAGVGKLAFHGAMKLLCVEVSK